MIGGLSRKGTAEEFEFWAKLNVDFIMLSVAYDFFLNDANVSRIETLKERYGLNLLIHPRPDGQTLQSPANPDAHGLIFEALNKIKDLVHKHALINKVILHLATYRIPTGAYQAFTEEEAIVNSKPFYQRLKSFGGLNFVLENVYPPGIGWEELGYETEHFGLFDLGEDYEFCLDTGHLNLSTLAVNDLLGLPFELTCLHLHGNDGISDQHVPLMRSNFKQWKQIEALLSKDKYIVLEVKSNRDKIPHVLDYLSRNEIAP